MDLVCALRLFKDTPLAEAIPAVRRIGFRGVELDWETIKRQLPGQRRWLEIVRKLLGDNELALSAVYLGPLTAEWDDQMQLQVRAMADHFEAISEAGGKLVVVTGGARTLENFNFLREGLMRLSDEASRYELDVAAANQIDTRLENSHDFRALFAGRMSENVGACLDVHHFHLATVNTGDVIREQEGRIRMVRMSDMMGTLPVMPGQGEIEIRPLVRTLRQAKFDGPVVLDHIPLRDVKIESELEPAYRYLQGIVC